MRAGGLSGIADLADDFPAFDPSALLGVQFGHVAIEGLVAVAVVDDHVDAVARGVAPGKGYHAVARGIDGRADLGGKVHAGVHPPYLADGVQAQSVAGYQGAADDVDGYRGYGGDGTDHVFLAQCQVGYFVQRFAFGVEALGQFFDPFGGRGDHVRVALAPHLFKVFLPADGAAATVRRVGVGLEDDAVEVVVAVFDLGEALLVFVHLFLQHLVVERHVVQFALQGEFLGGGDEASDDEIDHDPYRPGGDEPQQYVAQPRQKTDADFLVRKAGVIEIIFYVLGHTLSPRGLGAGVPVRGKRSIGKGKKKNGL